MGSERFLGDYRAAFKSFTGYSPYPYQERVAAGLLGRTHAIQAGISAAVDELEGQKTPLSEDGCNVLLRAPTGAGKTWAAIVPFLFSRQMRTPIADRLLYALPLRSLASSLFESTRDAIAASGFARECPVRLQTGETTSVSGIGDPKFSSGRIIFCTIDQILSSYLCTPFSLPVTQANVNAGALIGSLIVLDEYHLLDPCRSFRTFLLMNQHLARLARFVWMTATQASGASSRMLRPDRTGALAITVSLREIEQMPSQRNKRRRWTWVPRRLTAEAVWNAHRELPAGCRRTMVVVNTVSRAQCLYRDLKAIVAEPTPVILLHSRFLPTDRQAHEFRARAAFRRLSEEEAILVATQVVEAGLDLSAQHLHTELAPANALVQRAGRCARFENEDGSVFVYDSLDDSGKRSYRPYATATEEKAQASDRAVEISSIGAAIDLTALELAKLSGRDLDFTDELSIVDVAHTDLDVQAVESFDALEWQRRAALVITPSSDGRNYSAASDLIRDIDSAGVILAEEERLSVPAARLAPRFAPQSISVPRTSLSALSRFASKVLSLGTWCLKAPVYNESERGDGFARYDTVVSAADTYRDWLVASYASNPLVLNPLLARYDGKLGLELGVPSQPNDWQSSGALTEADLNNKSRPDWKYRAETFEAHVGWVILHAESLCGDLKASSKLAQHWTDLDEPAEEYDDTDHTVALRLLDRCYGLGPGICRRLITAAAALHDVGKLTSAWQDAIWRWQETKASKREHYPSDRDGEVRYLAARALLDRHRADASIFLAHSDYDFRWIWPDGRVEHEVERAFQRPSHALEGAWLVLPIIAEIVDQTGVPVEHLAKSALAAVAHHHSPRAGMGKVDRSRPLPSFQFRPEAQDRIREFVANHFGLQADQPAHADWDEFLKTNIALDLQPHGSAIGSGDWHWWPLAMLCVRIVRLADQRGTRMGASE